MADKSYTAGNYIKTISGFIIVAGIILVLFVAMYNGGWKLTDEQFDFEPLFDTVVIDPQTKYSSNPILEKDIGTKGIRDNYILVDKYGDEVIESGKYILYYSQRNTSGYTEIYRATFERPNNSVVQNVTKEGVVLKPSQCNWSDTAKMMCGGVIKLNATDYIMYWWGHNALGDYKIYYANSSDGTTFTPNCAAIVSRSGHNLGLPSVKEIQYGAEAGMKVMYIENDATDLVFANSSNWRSGWVLYNKGNAIIDGSDISWASIGPANPQFLEIGLNEYILSMNADPRGRQWQGGFMTSNSLTSNWTDYGKIVLPQGANGRWDDYRVESLKLFKNDFGDDIVGEIYFGCPTSDSYENCAIGYAYIVN